MSTVVPASFLTLHYRLAGPDGADVINTFNGKPATLSLGQGQLSPALEQRLLGLAEGAHERFTLAPGEAFGPRSAELVKRVSLASLREHGDTDGDYRVGDVLQFPTPDGLGRVAGVLRELHAEELAGEPAWALFDFNHPLAGQAVTFEVRLIGVI